MKKQLLLRSVSYIFVMALLPPTAVCKLLTDPDIEVQNRSVELLVKMHDPETMNHIVEVLKDESEFARRSAVEVLNEIAYVAGLFDEVA